MRQIRYQVFAATAFLLFGVISAGGQISQNNANPARKIPAPAKSFTELDDLIHFGDLIEVDVVGSTEFDWRGELTPDGTLGGLKFTEGPVFALCRNGDDVADDVKRNYSKFLNDPAVNIEILDRSKRPLAILNGAVKMPQRYQLSKMVTLKELIVHSGGFSENAEGSIEIRRQPAAACTGLEVATADGGLDLSAENAARVESEFREVKISEILSGDVNANVLIYYGDLVTVRSASPVYVIGNVTRPGRIAMSSGLTVGRAIAAVGGVLSSGDGTGVRVFRRISGQTEVIELPKETNKPVVELEFEVREYDIVEVFGDGPERLRYPPVLQDHEQGDGRVERLPIRIIN